MYVYIDAHVHTRQCVCVFIHCEMYACDVYVWERKCVHVHMLTSMLMRKWVWSVHNPLKMLFFHLCTSGAHLKSGRVAGDKIQTAATIGASKLQNWSQSSFASSPGCSLAARILQRVALHLRFWHRCMKAHACSIQHAISAHIWVGNDSVNAKHTRCRCQRRRQQEHTACGKGLHECELSVMLIPARVRSWRVNDMDQVKGRSRGWFQYASSL